MPSSKESGADVDWAKPGGGKSAPRAKVKQNRRAIRRWSDIGPPFANFERTSDVMKLTQPRRAVRRGRQLLGPLGAVKGRDEGGKRKVRMQIGIFLAAVRTGGRRRSGAGGKFKRFVKENENRGVTGLGGKHRKGYWNRRRGGP